MKNFSRVVSLAAVFTLWGNLAALETNPQAVSDLLNRIGGAGTASRFVTVVDETLTSVDGKETFVITSTDGKPCVKGSTLSALTTGLGWYLNHNANVNLAWNCPTVDLGGVELPLPSGEETHTTDAAYRYYLNYCTFSYSMSTWTWDRWQQEIDWMALHGVNMPLQIIGLEEVWRKFLMEDYGYSLDEVNDYVAGPCFMAWFGMNNLEGWGGPNPEWWYKRQAQLGKQINDRMRSLGIEPVLPGFCQLPSTFTSKTGIPTVGQGYWCGFQRPSLAQPSDSKFSEVAAKFYARVHEVMGESRYYSMDPFHEGDAPKGIDAALTYQKLYEAMDVASPGAQWVIQQWQWNGSQWKSLNNVPVGKLIILDLFSDGKPSWGSFGQHDVVYSTIFNFGGRTGFFGRFNAIIDGYWQAKTSKSTVKGVGAAPEAIEQTPVAYDLLFELPWMNEKPDPAQWMANYARRRYGVDSPEATEAWELLRTSSLNCAANGKQGPHEAVVCGRPSLTINSVSTWGFTDIFYDTNLVANAAYKLLDANLSGENYSFDLADQARQALSDYSKSLLAGLKEANADGNTELFNKRRDAFLQLILDLDELLNTNTEFMLGHWTDRARKMADEVSGTTDADRDWLELSNARTLITTWGSAGPAGQLRDYSYREWGGILKDFYYQRWKLWFDNGMKAPSGGWFNWEWNWAHSNPGVYPTQPVGDTREVASRILPKYLSPFVPQISGATTRYVSRGLTSDLKGKLYDQAKRDVDYQPQFDVAGTEIAEIAIDFSKNGLYEESETVAGAAFHIPADAPVGERTARITLADGTVLTFTLKIIEDITVDRTVSVATEDASKGTVSIDGTDALSVTNREVVVLRANADLKYDFSYWTDAAGNNIGNDNPMNYYSKEPASFIAHFVENKWGVPVWSGGNKDLNDMTNLAQFLTSLGVSQGGESSVFYTASSVPETHFLYVPTRIKAAPGGEFTFNYSGAAGGLRYLFLSAFADLNADGTFDINSDELLGSIGTRNSQDASVANGHFRVLLPYATPTGTTHIRLRFDSAWGNNYDQSHNAFVPDAPTNRLIYEILLEINEGVDYVTNVSVKSENTAMGTVRSENATNMYNPGELVILTAFPNPGYRLVGWFDSYGRQLPEEWQDGTGIRFTAFDNAEITARFEALPFEIDGWTFTAEPQSETGVKLTGITETGNALLDLSQADANGLKVENIAHDLFVGCKDLTEVTLPVAAPGEGGTYTDQIIGDGTQNKLLQMPFTLTMETPWTLTLKCSSDGSSFNQWGSGLFATGTDALAKSYGGGFQFYLAKAGTITVKYNGASESYFSDVNCVGEFTIVIKYEDGKSSITVSNADGKTQTHNYTGKLKPVSVFSAAIPKGVNVDEFHFEGRDSFTPYVPGDLFAGCSALTAIHVAPQCDYAVENDGVAMSADGKNVVAYPEGRLFLAPFALKSDAGVAVAASPVAVDEEMTATDVAVANPVNAFDALWLLGPDRLTHANSGAHLAANGAALSADAGGHSYRLVYGEGSPRINFSAAGSHLAVGSGVLTLADEPHGFMFEPVNGFAPVGTPTEEAPVVMSFPVAVTVPDGVRAFGVEKIAATGATLFEIPAGSVIPAGHALLLTDGSATFPTASVAPNASVSDNILRGTTVKRTLSSPYYVLEGSNFVRHASGTVPANSAYLDADGISAAAIPYKTGTVGIGEVGTEAYDLPLFDLMGRPIGPNPGPGLYVAPGRKVRL